MGNGTGGNFYRVCLSLLFYRGYLSGVVWSKIFQYVGLRLFCKFVATNRSFRPFCPSSAVSVSVGKFAVPNSSNDPEQVSKTVSLSSSSILAGSTVPLGGITTSSSAKLTGVFQW